MSIITGRVGDSYADRGRYSFVYIFVNRSEDSYIINMETDSISVLLQLKEKKSLLLTLWVDSVSAIFTTRVRRPKILINIQKNAETSTYQFLLAKVTNGDKFMFSSYTAQHDRTAITCSFHNNPIPLPA